MLDEKIICIRIWGRVFKAQFFYQFDGVIDPAIVAEGADSNIGGGLIGSEPISGHEIENLSNGGERRIVRFAGLRKKDVVSGPIRGESRVGLDHVLEERDRVVEG